ncbi:MAG: hypothetical protein IJL50_07535 [Bacteroidaceae bacterium]|nr:hypothetical protein [Bacteroidaceae bacterium]
MKISNEQIIASARRQRQKVESQMTIPPFKRTSPSLWGGWVGAVAASLVSFFAGYALHANMPQSQPAEKHLAQVVEVRHDTIMQVQTVRDTIYETRIVTKYEPMLAKAEASPTLEEEYDTSSEQKACSMLCDDIPYELLAAGR